MGRRLFIRGGGFEWVGEVFVFVWLVGWMVRGVFFCWYEK